MATTGRLRLPAPIICPCPFGTQGDGFDWIVSQYDEKLLPALGRKPTALGCMGFSAGAAYAVQLGILREARAVAVYGAVGVAERAEELRRVVEQSERDGKPALELGMFRDRDDYAPDPFTVAAKLPAGIRASPRKALPWAHNFADYARNDTVAGAFLFVLRRLTGSEEQP